MKIILNNLGVIIDGDYGNEVVNQSNHNINTLQFAIDDPDYQANYANYLATASFSFQGGEKEVTDILMGSIRFEFKGKAYNGYSMKLTRNLTGYAGDMSITFRLKVLNHEPEAEDPYKIIFASQPMQKMVTLTAGATVYAPNITQEQYNQLLEQVGLKIPFTEKGQPGGVATLNEKGVVPIEQISKEAYNLYPIFSQIIYDKDSFATIPHDNRTEGYYLVSRKFSPVPLRGWICQLGVIKNHVATSEEYTEDQAIWGVQNKLFMLAKDGNREDRLLFTDKGYNGTFFIENLDDPLSLMTWQNCITQAGLKVGDNKGDAFDTCRGQKLEQMIDQNYMEGVAVSEYDEDSATITLMGNGDFIDRIDENNLEELGEIEIFAKATDHLKAAEGK